MVGRGYKREARPGRAQKGTLAHIAQLAEHALGKGEVIGSNPIVGSTAVIPSPEGRDGAKANPPAHQNVAGRKRRDKQINGQGKV